MTGILTLLDIVKKQGVDAEVGLVEETTLGIPEISGKTMVGGVEVTIPGLGASRTIKGLQYKTLVRTKLPRVGFVTAGAASAQTKSQYENRLVETYTMNPNWGGPKTVLDKSEDGPQVHMALEAQAHVEAGFQTCGRCFYYGQDLTAVTLPDGDAGTLGDANGFPGLLDVYDATNMCVDAGGTTADTGSSVWLVKFGPRYVQWVYGANGQFQLSDVTLRPFYDATLGTAYEGTKYHQELFAYPGLQVSSPLCVCRIKKLTADAGKGLTDDLIGAAVAKFRLAFQPDAILMSKRSREQLRASRIAVWQASTGSRRQAGVSGVNVPTPSEWEGIPIVATESILNVEPLTL